MFKVTKFIAKDGKDFEGGRCIREKDGKLGFSGKDRKRIEKKSYGGDHK